jgi:hypothetical protein
VIGDTKNKTLPGQGAYLFLVPPQLTGLVSDAYLRFDESTELDLPQVDVPDAVVNLLKPVILLRAGDADIHLVAPPVNTAIVADSARLKVRRVV